MKNKKIIEIKNRFKIFYNKIKKDENIEGFFYKINTIKEIDENHLIKNIEGNFKEYYKNSIILGEGTLGLVKKTMCLKTNIEYAVKIIRSRDDEIIFQIKKEFNHIRKLNHENIIKLKELFIDDKKGKIYWIMEYFESEELFQYISNQGIYNEGIAKNLFKQLLLGINYLHSKGIIHRDLKPNNLLVSKNGKILKITDFNIAKFFDMYHNYNKFKKDNYKMLTYTGTLAFNAPEKFSKKFYTELIDCWSAGCVLYTMLIGKQPFHKEYVVDLIEQIKNNNYDKNNSEYINLSDKAKNLIDNLLQIIPFKRLSPKEALNHDWFKNDHHLDLNYCISKINYNKKNLIKNDSDFYSIKKNNSCPFSFTNYLKNSIDWNLKKVYSNEIYDVSEEL